MRNRREEGGGRKCDTSVCNSYIDRIYNICYIPVNNALYLLVVVGGGGVGFITQVAHVLNDGPTTTKPGNIRFLSFK